MNNCNTTLALVPNRAALPVFDCSKLPARLSKRLWVSPSEFLVLTHALLVAGWAIEMACRWRPCLPAVTRRGPKPVYADQSILVMALLQVAWQLSYGEIVDYLRAHPDAAGAAGFAPERVISVVVRQIAEKSRCHSAALDGIAWVTFQMDNAGLSHEKLLRSIELIGTKVAPLVNR